MFFGNFPLSSLADSSNQENIPFATSTSTALVPKGGLGTSLSFTQNGTTKEDRSKLWERMREEKDAMMKETFIASDALTELICNQKKILDATEHIKEDVSNIKVDISNMKNLLAEVLEAVKAGQEAAENSNQQKNGMLLANNIRLQKRVKVVEAALAAMEKQQLEEDRATKRKHCTGKEIKKQSTKTSSIQQKREEEAEEGHLDRQQAVHNGTVKKAPAFGPGRRFPDGKHKKKSPFKL